MLSNLLSTLSVSTVACRKCGVIGLPVLTEGTGVHAFKASCGDCGAYIQWVSPRTPEEQAARQEAAKTAAMSKKPATVQQLNYLIALGDVQPPPKTLLEASNRISALLSGTGVV